MNDGTRVSTPRQWQARRQEMRRILAHYAVGQMPPPLDSALTEIP